MCVDTNANGLQTQAGATAATITNLQYASVHNPENEGLKRAHRDIYYGAIPLQLGQRIVARVCDKEPSFDEGEKISVHGFRWHYALHVTNLGREYAGHEEASIMHAPPVSIHSVVLVCLPPHHLHVHTISMSTLSAITV